VYQQRRLSPLSSMSASTPYYASSTRTSPTFAFPPLHSSAPSLNPVVGTGTPRPSSNPSSRGSLNQHVRSHSHSHGSLASASLLARAYVNPPDWRERLSASCLPVRSLLLCCRRLRRFTFSRQSNTALLCASSLIAAVGQRRRRWRWKRWMTTRLLRCACNEACNDIRPALPHHSRSCASLCFGFIYFVVPSSSLPCTRGGGNAMCFSKSRRTRHRRWCNGSRRSEGSGPGERSLALCLSRLCVSRCWPLSRPDERRTARGDV
jgi:hypothetical protein